MWFIGVEVEQEKSAPPPKINPGSAPESICVHWNQHYGDLATERECQLTTARANHTTGSTSGRAANWAPEVVFSLFRTLSRRQLSLLNQPFYSGPTPRTDGFGFELINVSLSYSWWYTLILKRLPGAFFPNFHYQGGSCPGLSVITKKSWKLILIMLLIQINGAISVSFKFYPSTGKRHDPGKELCQTGRLTFLHFGLFIPLVLKYIIISPRMSWSLFWFLSFREQVVLNYCFPWTTSPQDNNSVEVQNKVRSYSSSSRLRMQAALHFLKPFTIE